MRSLRSCALNHAANCALTLACALVVMGCGLDVEGEPAPSCFTDPQHCEDSMDAGLRTPTAVVAESPGNIESFPRPPVVDGGQLPLDGAQGFADGGLFPSDCPVGLIPCGDACVNPANDLANCGGCGIACRPEQMCREGQCCDFDEVLCAGVCTDTLSDGRNCGTCGFVCEAGSECVLGICSPEDPRDPS